MPTLRQSHVWILLITGIILKNYDKKNTKQQPIALVVKLKNNFRLFCSFSKSIWKKPKQPKRTASFIIKKQKRRGEYLSPGNQNKKRTRTDQKQKNLGIGNIQDGNKEIAPKTD